ncbi:MAG: GNAT family N-acetyltransferase [Halobacteriaceae archaeon]
MTVPDGRVADVSVRQAVRADLFEVYRIEKDSFPQPWPFSAFERFLGEPGFLVATDDEASGDGPVQRTVLGYVVADCVRNHGQPFGHVKDIAVHPQRRGEGVGAALLARALDALRRQGATTAKLEVRPSNEAARSLYADFGFDRLRTVPGYYDDGEDALVYVRPLGADSEA